MAVEATAPAATSNQRQHPAPSTSSEQSPTSNQLLFKG
jgi:hypothetical protein